MGMRTTIRRLQARRRWTGRSSDLLLKASAELSLGLAEVEIGPDIEAFPITVRQRIERRGEPNSGVLALELDGCPFALGGMEVSNQGEITQNHGAILVGPPKRDSWDSALLTYSFRWDPTDSRDPSILQVPANIPRTGYEEWVPELPEARPAPTFKLIRDELSQSIVALGVGSADPGKEPSGRYLRLTLASEKLIEDRPVGSPVASFFTKSLARRLGPALMSEYEQGVREAFDFLKSFLDEPVVTGILLASQDDRLQSPSPTSGTVILFEDWFISKCSSSAFVRRFEILREVTAAYWGAGCQLVGRTSDELGIAIGAAVALTWAHLHAQAVDYRATLRSYKRHATRKRLRDAVAAQLGETRGRLVMRWALALHEKLRSVEGHRVLQNVTREFWAMKSPPSIILRELGLSEEA
jgi:hypothetical protein